MLKSQVTCTFNRICLFEIHKNINYKIIETKIVIIMEVILKHRKNNFHNLIKLTRDKVKRMNQILLESILVFIQNNLVLQYDLEAVAYFITID